MRIRRLLVNTCIAALGGLSFAAGAADGDFDRTFLGDYTKLVATPSAQGTDHIFVAPGAIERLAKYGGVMVDQPEILISPKSDYKGAKPADLAAIAALMRQRLGERLIQGGYKVAEAPGPGVIYVRVALTDLQLKKKKRGVLGYTPIGFVVKAGTDLVKDMMGKYDIMGMVIQAEVTDSQTEEVFGAIVAERAGTEGEPLRMDFEEFAGQMQEFSSRLRCRLDNSRVPEAQRIDCLDAAARAARETAAPAPKP
jgi:hypothetical protein